MVTMVSSTVAPRTRRLASKGLLEQLACLRRLVLVQQEVAQGDHHSQGVLMVGSEDPPQGLQRLLQRAPRLVQLPEITPHDGRVVRRAEREDRLGAVHAALDLQGLLRQLDRVFKLALHGHHGRQVVRRTGA